MPPRRTDRGRLFLERFARLLPMRAVLPQRHYKQHPWRHFQPVLRHRLQPPSYQPRGQPRQCSRRQRARARQPCRTRQPQGAAPPR
eukprot:3615123-Pleurochrysis_carterae.AAC.4